MEEILMQFPLRPKEQESVNSSENTQAQVPEHSHIWLSGTEFSYFENLVGKAQGSHKPTGIPMQSPWG